MRAPTHDMDIARKIQKATLAAMRDEHYISDGEYEQALAEPIALVDNTDLNHLASPYFLAHVAARDIEHAQPAEPVLVAAERDLAPVG